MKIDRIDVMHVAMPLIEPWRTAYGEDAEIHALLCRMHSGSVHAWGESAPFAAPCYSPEFAAGAFRAVCDWMAPQLLNQEIGSGSELQEKLAVFKGNPFAKAALDTAWWNLQSRLAGVPLHRLLGASRDWVPVGADFGVLERCEDLLPLIGKAVDEQFPRIKLKFRPGWDFPMLDVVRAEFPDATIHVDCNSAFRIDRDLEFLKRLDDYRLAMVEQPLPNDDLIDHAKLQQQIVTPVCLDESLSHPRHARQAIELGSCRFANIKPGRVGGLSNAVAMHDTFQRAGIPCWVGGMLESSVGASMCVALAMLDNFEYPADIFPSRRFYHEDLSDREITLELDARGVPGVRAPETIPEPDKARLARCLVQQASLSHQSRG